MRTDERVSSDLDAAGMDQRQWFGRARKGWMRSRGGDISLSISGYERNHLFLSARGRQFDDISGVSGLDNPADSRVFALLDYDRDGWQDIVLVNTNAPLLNLYHNDIGRQANRKAGAAGVIALRFVGGNHSPQPSDSYNSRDGYGATVTVSVGETRLLREHRCGEGFAAQNSATMLIGIGDQRVADSVVVRWPSGVVQQASNIQAGTLLSVFENPAHSPTGEAFVAQPYVLPSSRRPAHRFVADDTKSTRLSLSNGRLSNDRTDSVSSETALQPKLRMYTTTATWCTACKISLPQLQTVRDAFTPDELEMCGVPIDPNDGPDKLDAYAAKFHPAYQLRTDLTPQQVSAISDILAETTKIDALPSTIITDSEGRLLLAMGGVPTISQLRKLLRTELRDGN